MHLSGNQQFQHRPGHCRSRQSTKRKFAGFPFCVTLRSNKPVFREYARVFFEIFQEKRNELIRKIPILQCTRNSISLQGNFNTARARVLEMYFERCDSKVRRTCKSNSEVKEWLKDKYISAEHLLVALAEVKSPAREALRDLLSGPTAAVAIYRCVGEPGHQRWLTRARLSAGDAVAIPPGQVHQIVNTGAEPLVFLCCCAPAYEHADTVLVEKHMLTSGSTFHAAGLVGQLRTSANITQLLGNSVELYRTLEAETGQATGCPHPEIAIPGLQQGLHGVERQRRLRPDRVARGRHHPTVATVAAGLFRLGPRHHLRLRIHGTPMIRTRLLSLLLLAALLVPVAAHAQGADVRIDVKSGAIAPCAAAPAGPRTSRRRRPATSA